MGTCEAQGVGEYVRDIQRQMSANPFSPGDPALENYRAHLRPGAAAYEELMSKQVAEIWGPSPWQKRKFKFHKTINAWREKMNPFRRIRELTKKLDEATAQLKSAKKLRESLARSMDIPVRRVGDFGMDLEYVYLPEADDIIYFVEKLHRENNRLRAELEKERETLADPRIAKVKTMIDREDSEANLNLFLVTDIRGAEYEILAHTHERDGRVTMFYRDRASVAIVHDVTSILIGERESKSRRRR